MREQNYTIPINEAYEVYDGCPICRLYQKLEADSLSYVMGAAMMEPDVRIETNRFGFCKEHFPKMQAMQKKLPLALMLESYLADLKALCDLDYEKVSKREFPSIAEKFTLAADGCFVCNQIETRLSHCCSNIVYLWEREQEFRDKTARQTTFCPTHLAKLLSCAQSELPKKLIGPFFRAHCEVAKRELVPLCEDISKFCKSFDHRFAGIPMGEERSAVERTIAYLTGGQSK
ncbi:MAG: hypothetical protein IJC88_05500 [Oscillospiraceae bacterium]|nr:hypothetical protein [Oscillospiraceae bacterium]